MFNVEIEEQLYSLTIICLLVILFKCSLHLDKSAALMMLMETVLEFWSLEERRLKYDQVSDEIRTQMLDWRSRE